jgi:hypothetical protein
VKHPIGTQYSVDNNTRHNSNNHNSTPPEIPVCNFHDSTHWST